MGIAVDSMTSVVDDVKKRSLFSIFLVRWYKPGASESS